MCTSAVQESVATILAETHGTEEHNAHVCVQAAEDLVPPIAGTSTSARFPGIPQQGRPPCSVSNKKGGTERHLRTYNRDGREDSGGAQGGSKSVKIREDSKGKHHAKAGTLGYTYATLAPETHGRLGDEAKEEIRMLSDEACSHSLVQRSALVRSLKTELSVVTVKGNALVFQSCICQMARKTGKALKKRGNMPTCRSRIGPASH